MELQLRQLIDRVYKVAELRNLSDENPIKITLENPNVQGSTIIVVSYFEPHVYPLPFNVIWINSDALSSYYKVPLKRISRSPTATTPDWENSWERVDTFYDFFYPAQYYDSIGTTPEDVLHQQMMDHMTNNNNPHGVDYSQVSALSIMGGTLQGPLFLARDPVETNEAANKTYVDNQLANLSSDVTNINASVISQSVRLDGVEADYAGLESDFSSYKTRPNRVEGYRYVKTTPEIEWLIEHNLNSNYVHVQIYDDYGNVILPDSVVREDSNSVTVSFISSMSGIAVLNAVLV